MGTTRGSQANAAERSVGYDPIVAEVRAARDAYAAEHGYDIGAIFADLRAAQKASGRVYLDRSREAKAASKAIARAGTTAMRLAARSIRSALEGLNAWTATATQSVEELRKQPAVAAEDAERCRPLWKPLDERKRTQDALNDVGWLTHDSVPYRLVGEAGDDPGLLDRRVAGHYRAHWGEIRRDMKADLEGYRIDEDARSTFREALAAHDAALYRCVCRTLFLEIERVIDAGHVPTSMPAKLLADSDVRAHRFYNPVLLSRLEEHVYKPLWSQDDRARIAQDPVPNRHAAVYGLVPYSTCKSSMNMLILADFVFRIIAPGEGSGESRANPRVAP